MKSQVKYHFARLQEVQTLWIAFKYIQPEPSIGVEALRAFFFSTAMVNKSGWTGRMTTIFHEASLKASLPPAVPRWLLVSMLTS